MNGPGDALAVLEGSRNSDAWKVDLAHPEKYAHATNNLGVIKDPMPRYAQEFSCAPILLFVAIAAVLVIAAMIAWTASI